MSCKHSFELTGSNNGKYWRNVGTISKGCWVETNFCFYEKRCIYCHYREPIRSTFLALNNDGFETGLNGNLPQ
jgi:hypothetical protein